MCRSLLASLLAVAAFFLVALPRAGDELPDRLDDAKTSLVQLAAWFESLPPDERAAAARELRRWLAETYGSEVPFPFALPSQEEIAAWETGSPDESPKQADAASGAPPGAVDVVPTDSVSPVGPDETRTDETNTVPALPAGTVEAESTAEASPIGTEERAAEALPKAPFPKMLQPPGRCSTLVPFDTDGDGTLNGLDRYWRHLYLWFDSDGDRQPADGEMVSPFEYKIREIGLDLRYFVAGRGKKASRGELETDEYVLVDAKQDGFRATVYPAGDDAALAVDADALRRDPKGLDLRDASGGEVTGIQPFVAGWTIIDRDGSSVAVDCPG